MAASAFFCSSALRREVTSAYATVTLPASLVATASLLSLVVTVPDDDLTGFRPHVERLAGLDLLHEVPFDRDRASIVRVQDEGLRVGRDNAAAQPVTVLQRNLVCENRRGDDHQ